MPAIDWVHVAMFFLGLAMQWLASKAGAALPSGANPAPAQPAAVDPNLILDLAHKLLDERRQATAKP